MTERELARRLEVGINNVRMWLLDRGLTDAARQSLEDELLALRCDRAGVFTRHHRYYMNRHGVSRGRPTLTRPGGAAHVR